ncbi:DUF3179 domain-containing (seleno)protein, partial [Acinetobacter baumannii]
NYDKGLSKGNLTRRDTGSWKDKSWVVGIVHQNEAKAYDWNALIKQQIINDSISSIPILITLQPDSSSFHAYSRVLGNTTLQFEILPNKK